MGTAGGEGKKANVVLQGPVVGKSHDVGILWAILRTVNRREQAAGRPGSQVERGGAHLCFC
mgnify:CR=1 FL=1